MSECYILRDVNKTFQKAHEAFKQNKAKEFVELNEKYCSSIQEATIVITSLGDQIIQQKDYFEKKHAEKDKLVRQLKVCFEYAKNVMSKN